MTDPFQGIRTELSPKAQLGRWTEVMGRHHPAYVEPRVEIIVGRCHVILERTGPIHYPLKPFTIKMAPFRSLLTGKPSRRSAGAVFTRCPKYVALPGDGSIDTRMARAWRAALETGRWAG